MGRTSDFYLECAEWLATRMPQGKTAENVFAANDWLLEADPRIAGAILDAFYVISNPPRRKRVG
jgi:hypothetical protein